MAQQIKLKRSAIAGKVPTTGSLAAGELAINTVDGKLYFKRDDDTVQSIVTTNATITGSVNINGSITGSDIRINQWGSVSASLASIATAVPTLQQVTDEGSTTTNNIKIGNSITFDEGFETTTAISSSGGKLFVNTWDEVVGFNTTTPDLLLASAGGIHVNKNTGGEASIRLTVSNTGGSIITHASIGNDLYIQNRASGSIFLGTNVASTGVNQFTLSEAGNLSVSGPIISFGNTSNPETVLVIRNSNSTAGYLMFNDGTSLGSSPGFVKYDHIDDSLSVGTNTFTGLTLDTNRKLRLNAYGSGTVTGTPAYLLATDSSGNIIETSTTVVSASYAVTASFASTATSASHARTAVTASTSTFVTIQDTAVPDINYRVTFSPGTGAGTPLYRGAMAYQADTDTLVVTSISGSALHALSASYALTASYVGAGVIDGTVANATYAANTIINVKNISGAPIAKGTPLYITGSGTSGNLAGAWPADASNPLRMPAGAIAADAIADGAEGIGILNGFIDGVNTSAFFSGDEVYVAAGGGYTNIAPTGSNILVQKLGNVEKVHPSNGSGVINGPGTARSVPNIASGFTWVGDGNDVATPTAVSTLSVASAVSASHALIADAVNTLNQDVTVNGNLVVFGTASLTYVTSSQLVVDSAYISVNIFEPVERFGGLKVYDSGSLSHLATASLAWDSDRNHWVYQNASGSTYSGGMLLSGPRNTGSLGDEPNLTKWYVARSDGGDHLNDTQIFSSGSKTDITGSLTTTGKVTINTVDNYGADPDKFLAIVNGEVVYRTGAELLSDIGGQTSGTFVQNAGSGGQARYIMRYADSNSATTSSIYEDASGNIGIKTITPSYGLDINTSNIRVGVHTIGTAGSAVTSSLAIGQDALGVYTGSNGMTAIGWKALSSVTSGPNDAIGAEAMRYSVGATYNTAIGAAAGYRSQGTQNTFIGQFSGPYYHDLTEGYNTFIGPLVGLFSSGSARQNTGIGASALYNLITANSNTAIGSAAGFELTTGGFNTFLGDQAGRGVTTGTNNTVIGRVAGLAPTLSNNIIIGDGQGNIKYRYADNNTTISGSLTIDGSADIVQEGIAVTGTTSLAIKSINTTTYQGAFLDYVISSSTNRRAGTLTVVWTASDIEWKDVSTLDLGSTDGVEFAPVINGSNADIALTLPAGTWTLKGHLRYM